MRNRLLRRRRSIILDILYLCLVDLRSELELQPIDQVRPELSPLLAYRGRTQLFGLRCRVHPLIRSETLRSSNCVPGLYDDQLLCRFVHNLQHRVCPCSKRLSGAIDLELCKFHKQFVISELRELCLRLLPKRQPVLCRLR